MNKKPVSEGTRTGVQVIARAAEILRVLKNSHSGMSLGQIANRINLPRSTVQRIVAALQEEQFVIATSNGGGLRLGPGISVLVEAARHNIVQRCRLLLTELTQATGETADLSVMRGGGMIFLDQVPGTHRLRTVSSVGEVFPLTTTANGRACLASLGENEARKLTMEEWQRRQIDGDLDKFMQLLATVKKTGLAYDLEDHSADISAIGIAFRDLSGDLHAISVPVPTTRYHDECENIETALRNTALNVKKMLRY